MLRYRACNARFFDPHGGKNMKSIFSLSVAGSLLVLTSSVFAADLQATPATTAPATTATHPATTTTTTVTPAPAVKETRAERKAEKKQIEATEKTALAECKKLKGAEKKACKKQAEAQEKAARAELKAKK
jgi:hypothetical protein